MHVQTVHKVGVIAGSEQDEALRWAALDGGAHHLRIVLPTELGGETIEGDFYVESKGSVVRAPGRIESLYRLEEWI
jgi:hypothetical protein